MVLAIKVNHETAVRALPFEQFKRRNRYGVRRRLAAVQELEDAHNANRDHPTAELGYAIEGIFGRWGSGKTAMGVARIGQAYEAGYKAITINAGATFGYVLADPRDYYLVLQSGIYEVALLGDEIHTLLRQFGTMTIRQREAVDAMAGTRKQMVPQCLVSHNETAVDGAVKGLMNWAYYPRIVPPYDFGNQSEMTFAEQMRFREKRAQGSVYAAPPACYVEVDCIGPDPFQDRQNTLANAWGIELTDPASKTTTKIFPPTLDWAMRLYWTFSPVQTGLAHTIDSTAMRAKYADDPGIQWSDELPESEIEYLADADEKPDDVAPGESAAQRASRMLQQIAILCAYRSLNPERGTLTWGNLEHWLGQYGFGEQEVRPTLRAYCTENSQKSGILTDSVAMHFTRSYGAEYWAEKVIGQGMVADNEKMAGEGA